MAMNYAKLKPMKKTDPTYGATNNVHNGALIGTALYCTCGFYVEPTSHMSFTLDRFREHIVMVKGLAYADKALDKVSQSFKTVPVEPLSKDEAKAMIAKSVEEDVLDGDESFPEEAKEPFWDYEKLDQITKALAEQNAAKDSQWNKALQMAKDHGAQPSFYEPGKFVVSEQLASHLVAAFGKNSHVLSMFVVMKSDPYEEVPLTKAIAQEATDYPAYKVHTGKAKPKTPVAGDIWVQTSTSNPTVSTFDHSKWKPLTWGGSAT